jgi:acetolactate synthase-1/2/3 large subunit
VVELLGIPVATGWDSIDAIYDAHPLYVGRGGIMGDRAGNFAVQNSDLVFASGNRLSIRQVGYNWTTWAREAYVIMNDVDEAELKKPTLHVDMPVWGDAKELMEKLEKRLLAMKAEGKLNGSYTDAEGNVHSGCLFDGAEWIATCQNWKTKYPVVLPKHYEDKNHTNVYAFIKELSSRLSEGQVTVVGNGSACVVGSHAYVIKKDQRFIINSAIASMGYDLPAAIGAAVAEYGNKALYSASLQEDIKDIILVTGDGSIQMNIQELQTIIHHKMPIKIFVINNEGYHSIRQTQTNLFEKNFVGIGPQSGDLSFPDMGKLAAAYGYPYFSCDGNEKLDETITSALAVNGPAICEIFVSTEQNFEPKSATKRLEDGSLFSPPLEDLGPFLDREEFYSNMIIDPIS